MFEQLRERFAIWTTYRETVRQLGMLDRRILADAGIRPSEIKSRARAAARGPC
jgi:uncharacterized protein YjiS (DUF1127 family)